MSERDLFQPGGVIFVLWCCWSTSPRGFWRRTRAYWLRHLQPGVEHEQPVRHIQPGTRTAGTPHSTWRLRQLQPGVEPEQSTRHIQSGVYANFNPAWSPNSRYATFNLAITPASTRR